MQNSTFVSDTELNDFINASAAELYDILVDADEDYSTLTQVFTLSGSNNSEPLPDDFYKLRGVDRVFGERLVPLRRMSFNDRGYRRYAYVNQVRYLIMKDAIQIYPKESASGIYQIWYIPQYVPMVNDPDTFESIQGFDEYIVIDAAIKCKEKEESDTRGLKDEKEAIRIRVARMSQERDYGEPRPIEDVTREYSDWDYDV
jgi:hypothetical protein